MYLHPSYNCCPLEESVTGLCLAKSVGKLNRGPNCGSPQKATNKGLRGECWTTDWTNQVQHSWYHIHDKTSLAHCALKFDTRKLLSFQMVVLG